VLVLACASAVGLWPVAIEGRSGAVACGSAWLPDDAAPYRADESSVVAVDGRGGHVVACVQRLTAPLVVSVVTALVGVVVLVGAVRALGVRRRGSEVTVPLRRPPPA
jgi:hypothetical protein